MKKSKITASERRALAVKLLAERKASEDRDKAFTDRESLMHELEVHQIELEMQNDELQVALVEKAALLKEIHHRVKNNLAVITGLLSLQANRIDNPELRAVFDESSSRIKSMSRIHERLYQSNDLVHIGFKGYLRGLASEIEKLYKRDDVKILIEGEDISLDVHAGIPCGLIFNELISNCLKYAFPEGRAGIIKVGVNRNDKGEYVMFVDDDGTGFPLNIDIHNTESLGLHIVEVLTTQLGGRFELSTKSGTRFTVTFPGEQSQ